MKKEITNNIISAVSNAIIMTLISLFGVIMSYFYSGIGIAIFVAIPLTIISAAFWSLAKDAGRLYIKYKRHNFKNQSEW